MLGYLNWLYLSYQGSLLPQQRIQLRERCWFAEMVELPSEAYGMDQFDIITGLTLLVQLVQDLGYNTCYVLIDCIDELAETANDREGAADMLAPMIGNLRILEIPRLVFKFFVPSEVIDIIKKRGILRDDRIGSFGMYWDDQSLKEVLYTRLAVFSNDLVHSLASLAITDFRDIDERLIAAAQQSPRQLLNLGDQLFQHCAFEATDDDLSIYPHHLDKAVATVAVSYPLAGSMLMLPLSTEPVFAHEVGVPTVPLLRMHKDGSIWRGDQKIETWQDLTNLQRRFLEYLYKHPGELCHKEAIIKYVWEHDVGSEDRLRKLVDRVIALVEPDPHNPVYIQKIRGGYYRLDHAVE
jgi:hypothetical protein